VGTIGRVPSPGVAEQQVQRWLVRTVGLLWLAQLAPWAFAVWGQDFGSPVRLGVIAAAYVAYCIWGLVLFGRVLRDRYPTRRLQVAMLAVMTAAELVVGLAAQPGGVVGWQNWTPAPATGVGMLLQALGGWRWGLGSVVVLNGTYALTALRDLPVESGHMGALAGNVGQLTAFTIVGGLVFERLLRAARVADEAAVSAAVARAAEARVQERMRQYELLHTTVLTTLTVIARSDGTLSRELRDRCAREVERLRTLVRSLVGGGPPGLAAALAEVVLAQESLGLRLHHEADGLPDDVPEDVIEAIAHAVAEALGNIAKHAGAHEAWVVATGDRDGVRVTVTDRGAGFPVDAVERGVGLTYTLGTRVAAVGGRATVRSWPGEGTSVEVTWNR
jgi:signal transduction histidine kinase